MPPFSKVLNLHEQFVVACAALSALEVVVNEAYAPHLDELQRRREEEAEKIRARAEREARLQAEVQRQLDLEVEEARQEREQKAREREARHRAVVAAAEEQREKERIIVEEEKLSRAATLRKLNATPTRILLRDGIQTLHDHCRDGVVSKPGHAWLRLFDDTIRSLQQFTRNLAGHPDSASLKQLRFANENFANDIISRGEGAAKILYSLGYRPAGFGETKFLLLEEIHPVEQYTEWEEWWGEVKWTRDYLQTLIDSMRDFRRGVAKGEYDLTAHLPFVPKDVLELHMKQLAEPYIPVPIEDSYYS